MKHILVTGATGKVGSHFIQRLLAGEDFPDVTFALSATIAVLTLRRDWKL